jgi:preprotein translocase subunit YajC
LAFFLIFLLVYFYIPKDEKVSQKNNQKMEEKKYQKAPELAGLSN